MHHTIDRILDDMGAAGTRLNDIDACEAGAGNLSAVVRDDLDLSAYRTTREIELPSAVPTLAGFTVLVTGSGCRLRDIATDPEGTIAVITIDERGTRGTLHTTDRCHFSMPTSEFNSHLAVHADQFAQRDLDFHALIHGQPPYVVTLSHVATLASTEAFNRAILRWEPETIIQLPEGVGFLPFVVPGSRDMMDRNLAGLRDHQVVIWAKHGLMARSDVTVLKAMDKIEYVETGAMYEYRNMAIGGVGEGLTDDELRAIIAAFNVPTSLYQAR